MMTIEQKNTFKNDDAPITKVQLQWYLPSTGAPERACRASQYKALAINIQQVHPWLMKISSDDGWIHDFWIAASTM